MSDLKISNPCPCSGKSGIHSCTELSKPYIFISYSHKDNDAVCGILKMLQDNHFRFWYDEGITSGAEWDDVLYDRITGCTQFVCFFTRSSVESHHVKNEIHIARKYNKPVLPVFLDDVVLHGGLELSLDRQQSLTQSHYSETEFYQRLCAALDPQTLNSIVTTESSARQELEKSFRIIQQIGSGFSGNVYRAQNIRTGCNVIVKHGTVDTSYTGEAVRTSYEREAQVLSKQISCFTPITIDYFADESNIYLVESFIQGQSLNKLEHLTDLQIVGFFYKAAIILRSYHNNGIIHCDIKPEHMICNEGQVFLIDFGACYMEGQTTPYHATGTVQYAAPEQYHRIDSSGKPVELSIDPRTDIFALGRSLMFTLAKNHGILSQFKADRTMILDRQYSYSYKDNIYSLDQQHYSKEISPLLRSVIDKMTAENPAQRFSDMDEVITCLSHFLA